MTFFQRSMVWVFGATIINWCFVTTPCISQTKKSSSTSDGILWYKTPAPVWTQALPVGNGRMGAMVFGGANSPAYNGDQETGPKNKDVISGKLTRAQDEHLQLNEDSLWQGARVDVLNPQARDGVEKIRALLLAADGKDSAKIAEAEKIAADTMLSTPRGMPGYATLGDLYLRSADSGSVSDYRRELNINTGVVKTTYSLNGVRFAREAFASAPDHVIVLHLKADRKGALNFDLTMDRPADFAVHVLDDRDLDLTQGDDHKEAIKFQGQVRVLAADGTVKQQGDSLHVASATDVTLLIAAATDFKGGPIRGGDPAQLCKQMLDAASAKGYQRLLAAATADERHWMDRLHLQLGAINPALEALPTDERLARVSAGGDDLGLQALYFQYARYLLVGSSRPGGLPANLQGLWAGTINNPWGSKWTININAEMNYWMAEAANLGELHQPLFDMADMVRTPGTGTGVEVAQKYYGARGFVIHHNTDIWGDAHPIDLVGSGIWPMGGAWLSLHAWDHYAFTGDKGFLRARAYPLMKDAALFFLDYLVDDGKGHLVTGPSLSPENRYKLPDGSAHSLAMGPTMDIEITRELFERTLQAGAILNADQDFQSKIKLAMDKLPPFKIGKRGNLQEWQEDYDEAEIGHRHISHLWALFPGTQITPEHTPDLARAAQAALQTRLDHGGGQTGWSRAWVVNYWDHLGNGEQAYESMQVLFRQSTFPNLMDTHPPGLFQIDGNLGAANGMLDALVQSRWYPERVEVDLLPALPNAWHDGDLSGLRLRGDAELALRWTGKQLVETTWSPKQDQVFRVRLPAGQHAKTLTSESRSLPIRESEPGVIELHLSKGKIYKLTL